MSRLTGEMRFRSVLLAIILVMLLGGKAQTSHAQLTPVDTTWVEPSWTFLPSLFYSPKTKLAGGGSVRYFAGHPRWLRPNSVQAAFVYTARKQIIASLVPDLYFKEGKQRLYMSALYLKFPDVFYGIGNDQPLDAAESYDSRIGRFLLSAEQEFWPDLHLGVQTLTWRETVRQAEEGGVLETGSLPGSQPMFVNGLGLFLRWDTRDNLYYTSSGTYARISWMGFDPVIGSDFSFSRTTIDLRKFIAFDFYNAMAARLYTRAANGSTPFQLMPQVGGQFLMRGYSEGRYRDNVLAALQVEYRRHIWGPVSLTLFGSMGDVQPNYGKIGSEKWIFAGGPGLRLLTNEEGLHFRVDYGIGRDGGKWYLTLGEAF